MNRRVIAMLLATSMITSTVAGCGANSGTDDANSEASVQVGVENETVNESEDMAAEEYSMEEIGSTLGGKPWINSEIKENITDGMTATPQDDFYIYCNYDKIRNTEIPDGESCYGTMNEVEDIVSEKKLSVIKDESGTSHDQMLVNTLYKQITDWDTRNALGTTPIQKTVEDIENIKNMTELDAFITDYDDNVLVSRIIRNETMKDFDSDNNLLFMNYFDYLLQGAEEYSERSEFGERVYSSFKALNETILVKMGYSKEDADKMFDDAISFEAKIAEKDFTTEEHMQADFLQKINNHYTKEEVYKLFSNYPIEAALKNSGYDKANDIIVPNPEVFKRIDELYTADNLEEIKAFLIVNYVNMTCDYLDKESYDASLKVGNDVTGSVGTVADDEIAVKTISKKLSEPLQRAYLQKYDASEKKKEITEICNEIIAEYEKMLAGEEWLSEETKKKAADKLNNIKIKAVYPDEWVSDYKELELSDTSLLESLENVQKYMNRIELAKLNTKFDTNKWEDNCLSTNMYYDNFGNAIIIPLGVVDGEFYHEGISTEELYGYVGCIIGHEISHAFDPDGAQYDKDGNLTDWWTEADYEAFGKRVEKVDSFYDSITVWDGQNLVGSNIDTEAIADMGGMKAILSLAKNIKDFDYRKFFESYAKAYMTVSTVEMDQYMLAQDPHPLSYLRVNVTVQQFDEFYETYGIKEGDNMYLAPEDRILVW